MGLGYSNVDEGEQQQQQKSSLPTSPALLKHSPVAFLPLTYSLNEKNDKHVTAGVIYDGLQCYLGLLFTARLKHIVLTQQLLNVLLANIDHIQLALKKCTKLECVLEKDAGSTVVRVKQLFGKWYVQIYAVGGESYLSLTLEEWMCFDRYITCLSRHLDRLYPERKRIFFKLNLYIKGDEEGGIVPPVQPANSSHRYFYWSEQLFDEVLAYKAFLQASNMRHSRV